jgi:hypothetical protein
VTMHAEETGPPPLRCTKCDAFRIPLLRLEDDPHAYCENCFVVSGELVRTGIDDQGVEVWRQRRSA